MERSIRMSNQTISKLHKCANLYLGFLTESTHFSNYGIHILYTYLYFLN